MWNNANDIKNKLTSDGYRVSLGFFNNHYVKDGNNYLIEYFPIPIVTVADVGDIGIDISNYWIEIHLDKNRAILLDYVELAQFYNFEVHGSEAFCFDFYTAHSDPHKVAERISNCDEELINITFYFDLDTGISELVNIIKRFTE